MIEPGARLADRYRLEALANETGGASLWKATDETLARPVGVWTFADGFARTGAAVRAARTASRIADARVTQVFDADDSGPIPYVVQEWVSGKSLADLLREGPLEPERAAGLVAEAAEALTAAAAVGVHHLCLTPNTLVWSAGGAVKVTGVGVDAVLYGITVNEPEAVDAQGLGRLLYAALTAHWPGPERTGLRPAPVVSGRPCDPSQITPGIPGRLNDLVRRSAFQSGEGGGPLRTPQEFADSLADVPRLVPLPVAETPAVPPPAYGTSRISGQLDVAAAAAPPPRAPRRAAPPPAASRTNRILVGAVIVLVFVAVVMGAWVVGNAMSGDRNAPPAVAAPDDDATVELTVLSPVGADGFDPVGGDGEHGDKAPLAIDGDPSTQWNTQGYETAKFGNLKSGVGLLVDLGAEVEIHELDVTFGSGSYSASVYVRDAPGDVPADSEEPVWQDTGVSGQVPIKLDQPVSGQYVVVWFVSPLPQDGDKHRGTVNEVELRGIQ